LALGSGGLPGVSARASHSSDPAAFLAMQSVLPARHLACCAGAGQPARAAAAAPSPARSR
jgi:hypothetical protein